VANIASAQKQNRKMIKNRARNRAAMAAIRTAVKKARTAVDGKVPASDAQVLVKKAVSIIDSAVTKGILKRGTASRYVSRLVTRTPAAA
jgi:small subunit ribosomal protein S20